MMSDSEKDKLGDKLHDVEAARENEWAHKRDQELLEKMRREAGYADETARRHDEVIREQLHTKPAAVAVCPECKQELAPNPDQRVGGMICPQRHGAWLGWDTLARIMADFAHPKK
jgi:uncharacterized protein with PIN domain